MTRDPAITDSLLDLRADRDPSSAPRRRFTLFLRIVVSFSLLGAILVRTDNQSLLASLQRAFSNWPILIAALVIPAGIGFTIGAFRLRLLLCTQGIRLPAWTVLQALLVGAFFNNLLPTSVGGDAYLIWRLGRRCGDMAGVFSSRLLGRALGVAALCLLSFVGVALHPRWVADTPTLRWSLPFLALFVICLAAGIVLLKPPAGRSAARSNLLLRLWVKFATAFARHRTQPITVFSALVLSLVLQFNVVLTFWIFGQCLSVDLDFGRYLVTVPLVTLAAMVPISLNGVGIREWVMVLICVPLGVEKADAAMIAMLFTAASLIYAVVGAVIWARTPSSQPLPVAAVARQGQTP